LMMTYTFYVSGRIREDKIIYRGFTLRVFDNFDNIESFEKMNWYMQAVDDETVMEAVKLVKKYMGWPRMFKPRVS